MYIIEATCNLALLCTRMTCRILDKLMIFLPNFIAQIIHNRLIAILSFVCDGILIFPNLLISNFRKEFEKIIC